MPTNFLDFHENLTTQALNYLPHNQYYPGDKGMQAVTSLSKIKRIKQNQVPVKKQGQPSADSVGTGGAYAITREEYITAEVENKYSGWFGNLRDHLISFQAVKSGRRCHWCNEITYTKCGVCNVPLHNFPAKGKNQGRCCSLDFHDLHCLGLGVKDAKKMISKNGMKWKEASKRARTSNLKHINYLRKGM